MQLPASVNLKICIDITALTSCNTRFYW